jgi:hypothetical protein
MRKIARKFLENSRKTLLIDEHILKDTHIQKLNILGCDNYLLHVTAPRDGHGCFSHVRDRAVLSMGAGAWGRGILMELERRVSYPSIRYILSEGRASLATSSTCLFANNSFHLSLAAATQAFAMARCSRQDGGRCVLDFRPSSVPVAMVDRARGLVSPGHHPLPWDGLSQPAGLWGGRHLPPVLDGRAGAAILALLHGGARGVCHPHGAPRSQHHRHPGALRARVRDIYQHAAVGGALPPLLQPLPVTLGVDRPERCPPSPLGGRCYFWIHQRWR